MSRSLEAHLLGLDPEPEREPDPFAHMRPCPAPAFDDLPLDLQMQRVEHAILHIEGKCHCVRSATDDAAEWESFWIRMLYEYEAIARELEATG